MKITKSIKALVGSVALLAIAYAVAHAAALNSQPVGSILSCGLSRFSCTATISTLTGPASFTTTAVTFPTFQVAALGTAPSSVALRLAPGVTPPWQGTGSSPTLGSVTWQFDLSRVAPNTTITANTLVADFPATAHIRAHITGTIAAYPGVTFISQTPLDFVGTVNSYAPFINENFTLGAPVVFVDQANPTTGPSFTLTAINLQLNG